ncbi:unnamed protein product [Absidia cylindrospora]
MTTIPDHEYVLNQQIPESLTEGAPLPHIGNHWKCEMKVKALRGSDSDFQHLQPVHQTKTAIFSNDVSTTDGVITIPLKELLPTSISEAIIILISKVDMKASELTITHLVDRMN